MRIMNVKRAIIILLMIGIIVVIPGCVRYPGSEPEPGEPEYQLEITVEVAGEINSDDGIYYIVMDADEKPATGPGEDISSWEGNFYYVKLDNMGCWLYPKEEGSEIRLDYSISDNGSKLQVTIALSDLEKPSSVDINVVTTDTESSTTYDYLDSYFTIYNTNVLGSTGEGVSSTGLEKDKANFDIKKVTAIITTL